MYVPCLACAYFPYQILNVWFYQMSCLCACLSVSVSMWFSIASINFFSKRPLASESASADFLPTTAHCFNPSSHPRSRQRLVSNQNAKAKDIKYPSSHPRNRHHSKAATAQNRSQEYPFSPLVSAEYRSEGRTHLFLGSGIRQAQ